ncbi:longitudinals lacking protein, isoforms H/M/V-like [Diorhabda sublineata]|uniref:longitudinals lacking protein, isoforms H/M/V-like n=1 Tax=Diorhabda sublineata TaxID=1163346 RepID=UPI0024E0DE8E|nr:longitudinals lacking protein, isoforms H/M/V-like [Diorhabda sublineata]
MTSKHFCLKWNKFESNILSAFESLQSTEDLVDVTLTCEGINIKAHKFILSACSPYFRTIFKENPCPHPIVILKDVCHSDLVAIINFMYHGEVTVTEEQLASFLNTAMLLQVSGLMNNDDAQHKKQQLPVKKPKNTETRESPPKKSKLSSPKLKKAVQGSAPADEALIDIKNSSSPSKSEVVELGKIKTEEDMSILNEYDISENVEVLVDDKNEQGSILEAALEIRDKPSSILERSLTAQAVKSPSHFDKSTMPDVPPKTIFILRKPPDVESDKLAYKTSSESSTSPSTFEFPSEFLQQRIKTEDNPDNYENMSLEEIKEMNQRTGGLEVQPHHSSQWGNCPHCGKVYSNQSALKYHVRLVHSDLTNMYCCHLCPESFDYREGYKKHMAEVHFVRN